MLNLSGCDFGNPAISDNKIDSVNSNNQVNLATANNLQIKRSRFRDGSDLIVDALGVVPVTQTHKKYLFRVNNQSSKNYHLETLRIGDDEGKSQLNSDDVEVSGYTCKNLMAHASCSIQLETKTLSSADQTLEMEFEDDEGDTTQVNEPIRLSNSANQMNGFIVNLDEVNQVVTTDGDYSLSIPVLLTESFSQIKALNGSLICSGNGFKKGNSCSYLVSGHALADNTLVGLALTGYQGNTKLADSGVTNILVRAGAQANLIISHGAEIDPQSSHKSTEIMLHNTGTASATITKLEVEAPLEIQANQCPNLLATDSSCKIILKLTNPSEQLAIKPSLPLIVTYSSNNQKQEVGTNIYVKPQSTSAAAFTISNIQGGLTNTLLGQTSIQTVKIQNSGSVNLSSINIKFSPSPKNGVSIFFPVIGNGGCPSLGKNISLAPNQSCIFQLKYAYNVGKAPNAVAKVVISGKSNNTSFDTNYITNYSGINDANLLSIDPIESLTVLANSQAIAKSRFTLKNNLPEIPLTLNSLSLTSSVPQLNIVAESCKAGMKLNTATPSCSGVIQYGPQAPVQSNSDIRLSVKFQAENGTREREIKSNQLKAEAKDSYLPLITTKFAIGDNKPLRFSGKGTANDPYDFLALYWRHPLTLIYTFTNEGSAPAKNFKILNLDETYIYFNSSPNSCGLDDGSELMPGATCTLSATIATKNFLKLKAIPGIVSLKFPLIYSYGDQLNDSYLIQDYELTRYIQFSRDWLNASYRYPSAISPANNAWNLSITATVDIDSAITEVEKNISVTLTPEGNVLGPATVTPCTINFPNTSCVAKIAFPQTNYISGQYIFNMKGQENWTSKENALYQTINVNLQ
ncbi:MAG: hypothetical protein K2X04_09655 [Burkholderiales bacterium]|nr:hypothetical protein [Burkholderiales bacterium]